MPDAYTWIWNLWWSIAVLGLWPLTLGAYVATRTPAEKPVAKLFTDRVPIPQPPPRHYGICGIAGAENCPQVVGRSIR